MSDYLDRSIQPQPHNATQGDVLPDQVRNSSGGAVWALTPLERVRRFLILGSEGGSFYTSEDALTADNAKNVVAAIAESGPKVVELVKEISTAGRAPKEDPALFVLALCATKGDAATKAAALIALTAVARTGTHLFRFLRFYKSMRGKFAGAAIRNAVARWYNNKTPENLALQVVKYRSRHDFTHAEALRIAHPKPVDEWHSAIYRYIYEGTAGLKRPRTLSSTFAGVTHVREYGPTGDMWLPDMIYGFEEVQKPGVTEEDAARLVKEYRLPFEAVPNHLLTQRVWAVLAEDMPIGTALVRNLATLTRHGLLDYGSDLAADVIRKLQDYEGAVRARLHPLNVLRARYAYAMGMSLRGDSRWAPNHAITEALESLFYGTFKSVQSSEQRFVLGLDCSASMTWPDRQIEGIAGFDCRTAAAAMALVTMAAEPQCVVMGFTSNSMVYLDWMSTQLTLDEVKQRIARVHAGYTDCSLPMRFAKEWGIPADAFVIYTDNETNDYNSVQPAVALRQYRRALSLRSRLVVVGMVSNGFTVADPNDPGMLDVVGFDAAAPQLISEFAAGAV